MKADNKDILLEYLLTPEDERGSLTEKQGEILQRVISVISLLEKHRIEKQVIDLHLALTKEKTGKEINRSTAYRDLDAAKYIQGNLIDINRKFERASLSQWTKEVMAKALEKDDIRSFNMGMANLIKLQGLDRPDPIDVDYSKLKPVQPIFGFFTELFADVELPPEDELEREIQALLEPEKFKKKKGEYVDFEEISEQTDQESSS